MNSQPLIKRVVRGLGGQAFSRVSMFVNTLGAVPILLAAWGLTVYGEWIALTAVATLSSLSNFGLANAASTEIVKATSASDPNRAQRMFGTAICTLALIFAPVLVIIFSLAIILPLNEILKVTHVTKEEIVVITMAMTMHVWLNTVKGLFFGVTFSSGRYAEPNIASGLSRIFELACIGVVVGLLHGKPSHAAITIACVAGLDLVVQIVLAIRASPWLQLRKVALDRACLKMLMGPSIGTALLHFGVNFVGIQGPRIILSSVAGPAAVAVYSVYATAIRVIDQVSSLMMSVLQLEFSRTSGAGETGATAQLLGVGGRINIASFLGLACGVLLGGPLAFHIWTHGKVPFQYPLACAFLLATLFTQSAKAPLTYLMGANYLLKPVIAMLIAGALGLALGAPLARAFGPIGMATGQIFSEALTLCVVAAFVARSIGSDVRTLVLTQFNLVGFLRQAHGLLRESFRRSPA